MWTALAASAESPHSSRAVEAHAVQRLGLLAQAVGVGVGEDVDAVDAVDHAALAARVAGQAGVAGGVDVAGADAVAHAKRGAGPRRS